MNKYDIIGDIHGKRQELETILEKLGYYKVDGIYQHAERKAVFVGDYIDRGPDVKGVLDIVRNMVDNGYADAIVGNHEYNLLGYIQQGPDGNYLRAHSDKNFKQLEATFQSFEGKESEFREAIHWIRTLPLYLEYDGFRVAHAFWNHDDIQFLAGHYPENRLSFDLMYESHIPGKRIHTVINKLLKGIEIPFPDEKGFVDVDGNYQKLFRIRWWLDPKNRTFDEMAAKNWQWENHYFDKTVLDHNYAYPKEEKPLFLGHYCLPEYPEVQLSNLCCIDYCVLKKGFIAAYRWDGEAKLTADKLVY